MTESAECVMHRSAVNLIGMRRSLRERHIAAIPGALCLRIFLFDSVLINAWGLEVLNFSFTVPLPLLLDAANLAVHFSKARTGGKTDLYYTHVKHLRRAKNGPKGTVLPTQEKNLTVDYDPVRAKALSSADEGELLNR